AAWSRSRSPRRPADHDRPHDGRDGRLSPEDRRGLTGPRRYGGGRRGAHARLVRAGRRVCRRAGLVGSTETRRDGARLEDLSPAELAGGSRVDRRAGSFFRLEVRSGPRHAARSRTLATAEGRVIAWTFSVLPIMSCRSSIRSGYRPPSTRPR